MDFCKEVNVFQGFSEIGLPRAEGIASKWHFIKAITGNTLPAAVLPFGKYSCCCYTTGYPGGYGDHYPNSCPQNLRFLPEGARFHGLSHFHQSGTGAIDYYYNFAVTLPYIGSPARNGEKIVSEAAEPGYYSVKSGDGILSETTVSAKSVYHRFGFPDDGGKISVDFTNNGLMKCLKEQHSRPDSGKIALVSENEVSAEITLDGLTHYFFYRVEGVGSVTLMKNGEAIEGSEISFGKTRDVYGVIFTAGQKSVCGRLSCSLKSAEKASEDAHLDEGGFDAVRAAAHDIWNEALGKIEIEEDDFRKREIFYSNLYHSLIKPSDRSGENPLWEESGFTVDFSTIWDTYKTELPLIFTLFPDISEKIVNTIFDCGRHLGAFPHTLVLKKGFLEQSKQAAMLAEYSLADAYFRGVCADWETGLELIEKDIYREDYRQLHNGELPSRLTHLLDAADACAAVAELALRLGKTELADRLKKTSLRRGDCYDKKTGLLKENHDYYEGDLWNYSFRLHPDMAERVALAGGRESFTRLLDSFFGFAEREGGRFEGFNNEPDMETPYAYHFVGRQDRICEIISAANRFMFTAGRGGLPGNNDSGGLSSCYVWNTSGIFPVTGQDLMLIGSPQNKKTVFHLPCGKDFTVIKEGEGIYVTGALLDGEELSDFSFPASRMMQGGLLTLKTAPTII